MKKRRKKKKHANPLADPQFKYPVDRKLPYPSTRSLFVAYRFCIGYLYCFPVPWILHCGPSLDALSLRSDARRPSVRVPRRP